MNTIEHWQEGAPLYLYASNGENGFCDSAFGDAQSFRDALDEWRESMDEGDPTKEHYARLAQEWKGREIASDEFIYLDEQYDPVVLPRVATSDGSLR